MRLCGADGELPVYCQTGDPIQIGEKEVNPNSKVWELQKKNSQSARKVILLRPDGLGLKIAWLPKESASATHADNAKPKTPEAKRLNGIKMLQGKRWLAVREKLVAAIDTAPLASLTVPVDDLIATLGLPFRVQSSSNEPVKPDPFETLDARTAGFPIYTECSYPCFDSGKLASREEALWPAVKVMLRSLIPPPAKVCQAEEFAGFYERIGMLIQFDTKTAKMDTDMEILPPKCWGLVDPHTLRTK